MEIEARESLADESWSASLDQLHASNLRSLRIGEEKKEEEKETTAAKHNSLPITMYGLP